MLQCLLATCQYELYYVRSYHKQCRIPSVKTSGRFPGTIADVLPEAVKKLTTRLYESFEFAQVPEKTILAQLEDMTGKQF